MRKILVICLALLFILPMYTLAAEVPKSDEPVATPDAELPTELTQEELDAISAVEIPTPADWRETAEGKMRSASFTEAVTFETGTDAIDENTQYRYESKWDDGKIVLWQEVYNADEWAGYGLIFATRYETDAELAAIAARCREATLIALSTTHPKLSADKIETFLNSLCPDYAEVAKSPNYTERSAPLGAMMYTVTGGGTWGFPSIQAFHNANTDAYLRELQGTK